MALVTVGNNHIGSCYKEPNEICEDGGIGCGLLVFHDFPKGNDKKEITFNYYDHKPVNQELYDKYIGTYCDYIVPFVCTTSWENLGAVCQLIEVRNLNAGWRTQTIPLKRAIKPGEKCYVGFYTEWYLPRWDVAKNDNILYYSL